MLSEESVAVVTATAGVVAAHAEEITAVFYPDMLGAHPELLSVFNQGNQATGEQRQALAASVVAYAVQLIDPEAPSFHPILERIAYKHVSLGIRPEQYTIVGRHLLKAVGTVLGAAVTPEIARAWDEVYWLFASQLIAEESRLYTVAGVDPAQPWENYEVIQVIQEAVDVVSLVLRPVDGAKAPVHLPGQYISVAVNLPDGTRQPRQYTVSTGARTNTMQITVRRVRGLNGAPDGRVSTHLCTMVSVGDVLELSRPCGDVVATSDTTPLVLISAGVGITPIAAILEDTAIRNPQRSVVLAHADRSPQHHALVGAIAKAAASCTDIRQYAWYEEPGVGLAAEGVDVRTGLLDLAEIPIPLDAQVFMCGPLPFMRAVRQSLVERGVDPANIAYEIFGPDLWIAHSA
ncbi:MAG TPA: globin domain-containing protein [Kineosporiaceae bacterium]|nr:globin domain-containing protein [Kineosporiaceae bacterium]